MPKEALIVIDVQNYFVNQYTKDLPGKIARFIENGIFDVVLFTKFVNKRSSNFFKKLRWKKCAAPPGTELHAALAKYAGPSNIFVKSTYSVFKCRELAGFLDKRKIRKIALCGISTDACILASAYDGFDRGYDIEILEGLSLSRHGQELHDAALRIIRRNLQR